MAKKDMFSQTKKPKNRPNSVMDILGNDPERVWYPIDNAFNGYEVSDDCYVRSLKLYKDRWGCLIRPIRTKDGIDLYPLVDSDGVRQNLTMEQIKRLTMANPFCERRRTTDVTLSGRNKKVFQANNKYEEDPLKTYRHVSFTIIKDPNDTNLDTKNETNLSEKTVINPLVFF